MSQNRIQTTPVTPPRTLSIEPTKTRQTARPTSPFREILTTGANVLLAGAQAATGVVGLPVLSAAISRARVGIDPAQSSAVPVAGTVGATGSNDMMDQYTQIQEQRVADDVQLLQLQAQIQSHNRQITMASNVMKAKHDTQKAAINNVRS